LLDAPQWPSESSQGKHLLFFGFVQDVAHIDEGYMPHAEINVPGLILVGRFSSDPHWPVLGDRWGKANSATTGTTLRKRTCLEQSGMTVVRSGQPSSARR